MGGQDSSNDKGNSINADELNRTNEATYAKILQTSSTVSTPSSNSTSPSTTPKSSATTSLPAPSQQVKIDLTQWDVIGWFGHSEYWHWHYDFVKWTLLAIEEKETSEHVNIEKGLYIIKNEVDEMFNAGVIDSGFHNFCLDLITKCGNIRQSFDVNKRNETLNIIFNYLQVEFERALIIVKTIESMSFEQRIVLRFMVHQKIQARIAFLRTTLKTRNKAYDYHCITNPYYSEVNKLNKTVIAERDNLREEIITLKHSISDLRNKYNDTVVLNGTLLTKTDELREKNEELNKEFKNKLGEKIKELKQENNTLKSQLKTDDEQLEKIKELKRENITLKSKLEAKKEQLKEVVNNYTNLIQKREDDTNKIKEYEELIAQLHGEAEELRKEIKSAKIEASGYQSALGSATNIRWSDSTFINPIQLTKDIEKFQYSLADFTKVKGKHIKINENTAKQLLAGYQCKANPNDKEIKNYLAAALQRMIFETIFSNADKLYHNAGGYYYSDDYCESVIIYYSSQLIKFTKNLLTIREGQDSITAITPVKIRQQVYAALGSRGFAKSNHPFIKKIAKEILGKMEKYREVTDEEKKKGLDTEAEKIVRTGMQLWFCLRTQEPIPKIIWFKSGSCLETHLTVGSWENENVKELEVDFAFFPLIITEQDKHDGQVFNKAQVFVRPKQNGKFQKFKEMILRT